MQSSGGAGPRGLRASGSTVETRAIRFGRMNGGLAVANKFTPASDLKSIIDALKTYPVGADDGAVIDYVAALSDEARATAYANIKAQLQKLDAAPSRLKEFRSFFEVSNLERLTSWGGHRDASFPISTAIHNYGEAKRFFQMMGDGAPVRILISAKLWDAL